MIKGSIYTSLTGETFSLADLDADERRLMDELVARHRSAATWPEFRNHYIRAVDDLYASRGLPRREVTDTPVWKIAQDKQVPLRTAAYILGIGRVARATELAGVS